MDLSYITFLLFAAFSSLRMFSYLPQIYSVATDKNGASAISYSTWGLWIGANATTALYAIYNLKDVYLASVSVVYAACCLSVIILTIVKRRRHRLGATVLLRRAGWDPDGGSPLPPLSSSRPVWVPAGCSRMCRASSPHPPRPSVPRRSPSRTRRSRMSNWRPVPRRPGTHPLPLPRSEKRAPCRSPESSSRARPPRRARRSRRGSISRTRGCVAVKSHGRSPPGGGGRASILP